jgi:hypothetical protein
MNPGMSTTEEIVSLKAEIEGYKRDLAAATTFEEKKLYGELITACRNTLNALLVSPTAPYAGKYFSSCYWNRQIISHRCV